jgi:hypothetical protein
MHRGEREHIFASHIPSNAKSLSVLPLLLDGEMARHTDPREAFFHLHSVVGVRLTIQLPTFPYVPQEYLLHTKM